MKGLRENQRQKEQNSVCERERERVSKKNEEEKRRERRAVMEA